METQRLRRSPISELGLSDDMAVPDFASSDRLDALATRALDSEEPLYNLSLEATKKSIGLNPRRISNWNRIAYLDAVEHGTLTSDGFDAFRTSFDLAPYGEVSDMKWRLEFANAYWEKLPDDLKKQSLFQITALNSNYGEERIWLEQFAKRSAVPISKKVNSLQGR
jgi:hypothetical protein